MLLLRARGRTGSCAVMEDETRGIPAACATCGERGRAQRTGSSLARRCSVSWSRRCVCLLRSGGQGEASKEGVGRFRKWAKSSKSAHCDRTLGPAWSVKYPKNRTDFLPSWHRHETTFGSRLLLLLCCGFWKPNQSQQKLKNITIFGESSPFFF